MEVAWILTRTALNGIDDLLVTLLRNRGGIYRGIETRKANLFLKQP